jgi:hypothetical protein
VLLLVIKRGKITKLKSGIYRTVQWSPPDRQFGSSIWIGSWDKGSSRTADWRYRMSWKRPGFQITTALAAFDPD